MQVIMENKKHTITGNKILSKIFEQEYVPSPLISYEAFTEQKKKLVTKSFEKMLERAKDGIADYIKLGACNSQLDQILTRFFASDQLSMLQGKSFEELNEILSGKNLYGLEEKDLDEMLEIGDQICFNGEYERAIHLYQAVCFLFPNRLEGWIKWGNVEYQQFETQKSIAVFQECTEFFKHPLVYFCLGMSLAKVGDFKQAATQMEIALDICDKEGNFEELMKEIHTIYDDLKSLNLSS